MGLLEKVAEAEALRYALGISAHGRLYALYNQAAVAAVMITALGAAVGAISWMAFLLTWVGVNIGNVVLHLVSPEARKYWTHVREVWRG